MQGLSLVHLLRNLKTDGARHLFLWAGGGHQRARDLAFLVSDLLSIGGAWNYFGAPVVTVLMPMSHTTRGAGAGEAEDLVEGGNFEEEDLEREEGSRRKKKQHGRKLKEKRQKQKEKGAQLLLRRMQLGDAAMTGVSVLALLFFLEVWGYDEGVGYSDD